MNNWFTLDDFDALDPELVLAEGPEDFPTDPTGMPTDAEASEGIIIPDSSRDSMHSPTIERTEAVDDVVDAALKATPAVIEEAVEDAAKAVDAAVEAPATTVVGVPSSPDAVVEATPATGSAGASALHKKKMEMEKWFQFTSGHPTTSLNGLATDAVASRFLANFSNPTSSVAREFVALSKR